MMTLYLAGSLFTLAERQFNIDLAASLAARGYACLLPQRFSEGQDRVTLASLCLQHLNNAKIVLVNCDGPDVESGTAFEAGFAYARGIPIIAYRTDYRAAGDDVYKPVNLMIGQTAIRVIVSHHSRTVSELADEIDMFIKQMKFS